jgi:chromosome partitioning protein
MNIIALINQKGGVAKTTSSINLGAGLSSLGKKILLIDLDPQAHLTYSLGIKGHELKKTVYELLKGECKAKDVIIDRNGLKVIPSTIDLSAADMEFSGIPGRELLLKEAMESIKGFDYVLMDCPPSLGILTFNAMTVAQAIYIPLQAEVLALQGMAKLLNTVKVVKRRFNRDLEIEGIIVTRFDGRKNLNKEVLENIQTHFGDKVFKTVIRENIALAEAPSYGQNIYEYNQKSSGAEDYLNLSKEIIERS